MNATTRASGKKIVIIGATSAIAEQCARLWAAEAPAELVLVGRDESRLATIGDDLQVRAPGARIRRLTVDFQDPAAIDALIHDIAAEGAIDIALVAHGMLPDQHACQHDLAANRQALMVNAVSPVLFAEALASVMLQRGHGTVAIIGVGGRRSGSQIQLRLWRRQGTGGALCTGSAASAGRKRRECTAGQARPYRYTDDSTPEAARRTHGLFHAGGPGHRECGGQGQESALHARQMGADHVGDPEPAGVCLQQA